MGYSWLSAKEPLIWVDLLLLATCLLILWCWNMCVQATWCGRWKCADVFCKVVKHFEMPLVATVNLQYKQMSKMLEKKMWECETNPGLAGSSEFLGSDWMFQPAVLQPKPLKGTAVLTGVAKGKDFFSEKPIERKACTDSVCQEIDFTWWHRPNAVQGCLNCSHCRISLRSDCCCSCSGGTGGQYLKRCTLSGLCF